MCGCGIEVSKQDSVAAWRRRRYGLFRVLARSSSALRSRQASPQAWLRMRGIARFSRFANSSMARSASSLCSAVAYGSAAAASKAIINREPSGQRIREAFKLATAASSSSLRPRCFFGCSRISLAASAVGTSS